MFKGTVGVTQYFFDLPENRCMRVSEQAYIYMLLVTRVERILGLMDRDNGVCDPELEASRMYLPFAGL